MKKTLFAVATGFFLGILGCGNTCSHMESASNSVLDKAKPCSSIRAGEGEFSQQACEEALKSCSDEDKKVLDEKSDCLEGMPACISGEEATFFANFDSCSTSTGAVSQTCATALIENQPQ